MRSTFSRRILVALTSLHPDATTIAAEGQAPPPTGIGVEVAALALVAGLSLIDNRAPRAWRVPANLACAAAMVGLARIRGATLAEQGVATESAPEGLRLGVCVGAAVAAATGALSFVPQTRQLIDNPRIDELSIRGMLYESVVRVPLGTALPEELICRGALPAMVSEKRSRRVAVAVTSLLFGLWHILPTYDRIRAQGQIPASRVAGRVALSVLVTTAAGWAFSWLRYRSGSVIAPAIVHTKFNSSGIIGSWLAARLSGPSKNGAEVISPQGMDSRAA